MKDISFDFCVLIFFFQAEDGIRDWSVTGVQTCALPISVRLRFSLMGKFLGLNLYRQQWEAACKFALCNSTMTEYLSVSI